MDERSEKIVTLARAMLQEPTPSQLSSSYSLKTVILAALISAVGAGGLTLTAAEQYRPLNVYEKTELRALIHYAAKLRHIEGAMIEADMLNQFGIRSIDDFSHAQMREARIFLQKYINGISG